MKKKERMKKEWRKQERIKKRRKNEETNNEWRKKEGMKGKKNEEGMK